MLHQASLQMRAWANRPRTLHSRVVEASNKCMPCLPVTRLRDATTRDTDGLQWRGCGRVGEPGGRPRVRASDGDDPAAGLGGQGSVGATGATVASSSIQLPTPIDKTLAVAPSASENQRMPRISAPSAPKSLGRKPDASSTSGKIRTLLGTGMAPGDIARKLGCSPALVYNVRARQAGGGRGRSAGGRRTATRTPAKADGLDGILAAVKNSEAERLQLRAALEKVAAVLRDALD
jgi:transposase-like protein